MLLTDLLNLMYVFIYSRGLLVYRVVQCLRAVFVFLQPQGFGSPTVYHAVIVIFLEFFAWGLLTAPTLVVSSLVLLMALSAGNTTCVG